MKITLLLHIRNIFEVHSTHKKPHKASVLHSFELTIEQIEANIRLHASFFVRIKNKFMMVYKERDRNVAIANSAI